MSCRSDNLKTGVARAPHRSLLKALGFVDEEMGRPVIGIANSFNEIIPGHVGLKNIVQAVKDGIRNAGGVPIEFNTIGICDGLAMNHIGMKYSLVTRNKKRITTGFLKRLKSGLICKKCCKFDRFFRFL